MIAYKVGAGDGRADPFQIGSDLAADIAAVEIVESGMAKVFECRAERFRPAARTGLGRCAVVPEGRDETGRRRQRLQLVGLVAELGIRERIALAAIADRISQQFAQRHAAAERARKIEGELPAADGAGDAERCFRPAGGYGVVALVAIALDRRQCAGRTAGLDAVQPAAGLMHQPEAVAADAVHVRVDHRDRRRHRDHGLDRIAAFGEDGPSRLGGEAVGRRHGGGGEDGRIRHQGFSISEPMPIWARARICCMGRQAPLGA